MHDGSFGFAGVACARRRAPQFVGGAPGMDAPTETDAERVSPELVCASVFEVLYALVDVNMAHVTGV